MKLKFMKLQNYRQFEGIQRVNFETDSLADFSVVYGTNGGGKTTLLSAVLWAFHGEVRFIKSPSQLASSSLFSSEDAVHETAVSIGFEDSGIDFEVTRSQSFQLSNGVQIPLSSSEVSLVGPGGQKIEPAQREINKRLPLSLARFLLFPGEGLDGFFGSQRLADLQADVKKISKIGLYEETSNILLAAHSRLLNNLRTVADDQKLRLLSEQQLNASNSLESSKLVVERIYKEIQEKEKEIEETKLVGGVLDDDVLTKYNKLNNDIAEEYQELGRFKQLAENLFHEGAYVSFLDALPQALDDLANHPHLAQRSELNLRISDRQFAALRTAGVCICGKPLDVSDIDKLAMNADGISDELELGIEDLLVSSESSFKFDAFRNNYVNLLNLRIEKERQIYALEGERNGVLEQLGPNAQSQAIIRETLQRELADLTIAYESAQSAVLTAELEAKATLKKLTSAESDKSASASIQNQLKTLDRLRHKVAWLLEDERTRFMSQLHDEVSNIVKNLIASQIDVELADDLSIRVLAPGTSVELGLAEGESKAKPIAMAIALQRIASRMAEGLRIHNPNLTSEYPLLIDSAFGELGTGMRRRVVDELAKSGGQTVLLVSDTQAGGLIDYIPQGHLGRQVLLHAWRSKEGVDEVSDLGNLKVTWQSFGSTHDYTTIEELK